MGAVLTAGLGSQLLQSANAANSVLTPEQAASFASNPNALIDPAAKATLAPATLNVLQEAMVAAVRPVFWVGVVVCFMAFLTAFALPKKRNIPDEPEAQDDCGETMLMAEQTTINARNQPVASDKTK